MPLFLDIGHFDRATRQSASPGACLAVVPPGTGEGHGLLLACAEGLPDRPEPQQAAKTVVTILGDNYYAATIGQPPKEALEDSIACAHRALTSTGERGRAAAVAALVLRGRHWWTAHAGSVRAWLYRDLQLNQLTRDHAMPRAARRPEITKACGLFPEFEADYGNGTAAENDIFLITSTNVHDALPSATIMGVLQSDSTAQQMAEAIAQRAITAGVKGYIGVCVARVERLPTPQTAEAPRDSSALLPVIEPPAIGATVDGFLIEEIIHKSRRIRLYKALDGESRQAVTLRFPNPSFYSEPRAIQSFLREEAIGRRVDNPHILKSLTLRAGRRTALYSVMEYREGENLAKHIKRKQGLDVSEALHLGEQLLHALEALHSQGIVHGGVRANNLVYNKEREEICLLGMGTSSEDVQKDKDEDDGSSTSGLSYLAPELLKGASPSESSDLFAAGVVIYRMLTGAYPYGKIRATDSTGAWEYTSVNRYKDGLPAALDDALRRACAVNPKDRYPNIAQFSAALVTARALAESSGTQQFDAQKKESIAIHWPTWIATGGLIAALGTYLYFVLR